MNFQEAGKRWGIEFPEEMENVSRIDPGKGVLIGGQPVGLPWPPLSATEISTAQKVAADWQLPPNFIPIMGDFHDLVCLDYSRKNNPGVVIINDAREELVRFESLKIFLQSLVIVVEGNSNQREIIEDESWLDF